MSTANIIYGYNTRSNVDVSTLEVFHFNLGEEDASPSVVIPVLRKYAEGARSSEELVGKMFINSGKDLTAGKDFDEYADFVIGPLDNPTYTYRIIDLECELALNPDYVDISGLFKEFEEQLRAEKLNRIDIKNTRVEVVLEDQIDEKDKEALIKKYKEKYGSLGEIVIGKGEPKLLYAKKEVSKEKLMNDLAKVAAETSKETGQDVMGIAQNTNERPSIVVRYSAIILKAPLVPKKDAKVSD